MVERNNAGQLRLLSEKPYARLLHAVYDPSSNSCWYSRSDGLIYSLGSGPERVRYTGTGKALPELFAVQEGRLLCLLGGRFTAIDTLGSILHRESDAAPLSMLSGVLPEKGWLYTVASDHRIRIWDPDNGKLVHVLDKHTGTVLSVARNNSGTVLCSGGRDGNFIMWNAEGGKSYVKWQFDAAVTAVAVGTSPNTAFLHLADGRFYHLRISKGNIRLKSLDKDPEPHAQTRLQTDTAGKELLVWHSGGRCELRRFSDGKLLGRYRTGSGLSAAEFHSDELFFAYSDGRIARADRHRFRSVKTVLTLTAPVLHLRALGGDTLACSLADGKVCLFTTGGKLLATKTLHPGAGINLEVSGTRLLSADAAGNYGIWNWKNGETLQGLYPGGLMSALLFRDGQYALFAGMDQFLALHDAGDAQPYVRLLPLSGRDWISLHRSGLFDATEAAMEHMFWIRGERILEFARLKARYWEPGLWSQAVQRQKLRDVQGFDRIGMHPDLRFGRAEDGLLPIHLQRNDGGMGRVAVYINGKEISADARGPGFNPQADSAVLNIDLRRHPFLLPGKENEIMVKTWTADGLVESRGAVCRYTAPTATTAQTRQPRFFGIVCGTGSYKNSDINLRYSVPDALAVATGITEGANRLFGASNTQVRVFTQPGARPGTRENLQAAFDSIAAEAKPEDIVFIYLSGHGISTGGEDGEFCYLLPDAFSADAAAYSDPKVRQRVSLGTAELSQMLNRVPALKQVLIIDACGSGKVVDNLAGKREIEPVQIRAFDRMRDRTGTFILSGCAADAVSYEASRYGQGLLTYALLQGMRGGSLKEAGLLDVAEWFQFARERVPVLARGIGGLQEPQMLLPRGGSIDIVQVDMEIIRKIPLANIKPVFIQSLVQDEAAFEDVLKVGELLDRRMFELSARGASAPIAFFEVKRFADACQLFGRYSREEGKIVFKGKIKCPDGEIPVTAAAAEAEQLVAQLMEQISQVK